MWYWYDGLVFGKKRQWHVKVHSEIFTDMIWRFGFALIYIEGKMDIVVWLACYNKVPKTRWLKNSRNVLLFKVLDSGGLKPGCPDCLVRGVSWAADFLLHPHVAERVGDLSGASLIRALITFMRAPPTWFKHLPKAPPTNTITSGV